MKNTDEMYDLIEKYLRNELDKDSRKAFEKKLESDMEFNKEFQIQKAMYIEIRHLGKQRMKEQLDDFHNEIVSEGNVKSRKMSKVKLISSWVIISAAASILVFIAIYYMQGNGVENYQQLFTEFYEVPEASFNLRSEANDSLLSKAEAFFNDGKFQDAAGIFELLMHQQDDDRIKTYYGISLLELGRNDKAREQFSDVLLNPILADQAYWFLAMSYLKSGDIIECRNTLTSLLQYSNSEYYEKAQELNERLDSDIE